MTWYVIRTTPGAQHPQREFAAEPTKSRRGYRIVNSLNPDQSAVERALWDAGVRFYMPAEFKVIRNRRKTGLYSKRRFPLLPGYVFVNDVTDWLKLQDVPGVAGVVSIDGKPLPIPLDDIMRLRTIEARSLAEADRDAARMTAQETTGQSKAAKKALLAAKRRLHYGARVKVLWGAAVGREATVLGWDDQGHVSALVERLDATEVMSIAPDMLRVIAA